MTIKSLAESFATALLLAAGAIPFAVGASGVTVELKMTAPDYLVASYVLPADCSALRFDKHGADGAAIRRNWQVLDRCGSVDGDALQRKDQACPVVRVHVAASAERRPGYPPAFPLGEALYVHTSNFAVGPQCGPVTYRFIAPTALALQGRTVATSAEVHDGGDMGVLLSSVPLDDTPEGIRYYAPGLGAANVEHIDRVARGTIAYLKAAMPDAPFRMPVLAAARVPASGGVGIDGDASDVLRLGLLNWPAQPSTADREQLTLLVSHEFSHRFQLRDAFDSYADGRLIHEGGAEFLRWVVGVQNGWLSRQQAARVLDDALAECLLGTGQRAWRTLSKREIGSRQLAYRCGLPAYAYALAARQGSGTALTRFSGLYRSAQEGRRPDFAQVLECGDLSGTAGTAGVAAPGGAARCLARWLPELLERDVPMRRAFGVLFDTTALARPIAATPSQRKLMLLQAFEGLMEEDCGSASYFPGENVIIVDDDVQCRALKGGMRITQVEGVALSDPGAVLAMSRACAGRKQVRLGLEQGGAANVACSTPYDVGQLFYGADIDALLAALQLPPAPLEVVSGRAASANPPGPSAVQ